jgi:hypothetical protein
MIVEAKTGNACLRLPSGPILADHSLLRASISSRIAFGYSLVGMLILDLPEPASRALPRLPDRLLEWAVVLGCRSIHESKSAWHQLLAHVKPRQKWST